MDHRNTSGHRRNQETDKHQEKQDHRPQSHSYGQSPSETRLFYVPEYPIFTLLHQGAEEVGEANAHDQGIDYRQDQPQDIARFSKNPVYDSPGKNQNERRPDDIKRYFLVSRVMVFIQIFQHK